MSIILAIKLEERLENSLKLQKILSNFGCQIKTRLGLHDIMDNCCTNWGIIVLQFVGDEISLKNLEKEISEIQNTKIGKIIF